MTWQTGKTSEAYTECILIWPTGKRERKSVNATRLDSVKQAREKLAQGVAAWVSEADAERLTDGE